MDTWIHAVSGASGLSWLHLLIAVTCLISATLSPALRLPGIVCGAFYIFGVYLDASFGPPPAQWEEADHVNYYSAFALLDVLWLCSLMMIRKAWAGAIQTAILLVGVLTLANPFTAVHDYYDQIITVLNVMFITALLLNDHITRYFCDKNLKLWV